MNNITLARGAQVTITGKRTFEAKAALQAAGLTYDGATRSWSGIWVDPSGIYAFKLGKYMSGLTVTPKQSAPAPADNWRRETAIGEAELNDEF